MRKERLSKKVVSKVKDNKAVSGFKKEFNNSMNTAIIAAFGFLIALSWRDLISESVNKLMTVSPFGGSLISAIIVTIIGVLGIMIVSHFFSKKE